MMAKALIIPAPTRRLIIDLEPFEAETLKAVMQNPLYDGAESAEMRAIREVIWNALHKDGVA